MSKTSEQALYEVLSAYAGLTALVGTRIYPVEAPEGADMPLLVFQQISTTPETTHDEGSASRLDAHRYQLTAYATTMFSAAQIIYQARLALEQSALSSVMLDQRATPRSEGANCFGSSADFQVWNYPDA